MGLSGTIDGSVYTGLKDILQRYPRTTSVMYEPDSITKRTIRADVDPARVVPPTGPRPPTLEVEWRFDGEEQQYRIHYADPNTGFNCGWHRDDDHPDLGPVHFQYVLPQSSQPRHERAHVEKEIPTEILWEVLDTLFHDRIPELTME